MKINEEITREDSSNVKRLPIFHTTKKDNFMKIVNDSKIKIQYNKYLKKNCAFFFYGRAMYSEGNNDLKDVSTFTFLPIAVCMPNTVLNNLSFESYAVDSGGFIHNKFFNKLPKHWDINGMKIGESQIDIDNYIKTFYDTSKRYIDDFPLSVDSSRNHDFQTFQKFLDSRSSSKVDGRARTIEIALREDVKFTDQITIFVHNKMSKQVFFRDLVKDLESSGVKVGIRKYFTVNQVSPVAAYSCMNGEVLKFMEELS